MNFGYDYICAHACHFLARQMKREAMLMEEKKMKCEDLYQLFIPFNIESQLELLSSDFCLCKKQKSLIFTRWSQINLHISILHHSIGMIFFLSFFRSFFLWCVSLCIDVYTGQVSVRLKSVGNKKAWQQKIRKYPWNGRRKEKRKKWKKNEVNRKRLKIVLNLVVVYTSIRLVCM